MRDEDRWVLGGLSLLGLGIALAPFLAAGLGGRPKASGWLRPLAGELVVTSPFGKRRAPTPGASVDHLGVDLRAPVGTPVLATIEGKIRTFDDAFCGRGVEIIGTGPFEGQTHRFCHLQEWKVQDGVHVYLGQEVGRSGETGRISGPHLHWSVQVNSVYHDPMGNIHAV